MSKLIKKPVNRAHFFASVKASLFGGPITQKQVNGIEAVINEFEKRKLTDLRWLAYMLATAFHETGRSMQSVEEIGKGRGRDYGKKLKMNRKPYYVPDELYYGRGLVQLTWYDNYLRMGNLLGIDLLTHPEMALQMDIAVKIMFEGMLKAQSSIGDFTGVSLEKYFNANTEDWVNARKVINGLDRAETIAAYGKEFYKALLA